MSSLQSSFWKAYRVVFTIFFLYLTGDAFYRWDGFKYYASLSEFIYSLCLVTIFWSAIVLIVSLVVWLPYRIISLVSKQGKWSGTDRFLLFAYLVPLITVSIKIIKRQLLPQTAISFEVQLILLFGGIFIAVISPFVIEKFAFRAKLREKYSTLQFIYILFLLVTSSWIYKRITLPETQISLQWMLVIISGLTLASIVITWLIRNHLEFIQERITPLVWLFGLFVLISIPTVGYKLTSGEMKTKIVSESDRYSQSDRNRPNIILLTFDAMSASDMSAYGYHRATTPYMTEWAKKAFLFSRPKASGNWTTTTTASLMTGKRVWTHSVFQPHGFKIDKGDTENLPNLLKQNGYYIMGYIANSYASLSRTGLAKYFDINYPPVVFKRNLTLIGRLHELLAKHFGDNFIIYDWIINEDFIFGKALKFVYRDLFQQIELFSFYDLDKVFDRFFNDIDLKLQQPFFAWIHLYQPHNPYIPPKHLKGKFGPITSDANEMNRSRDRYDEFILYCDEKFKYFIHELEERKLLNNTIIILSADHGEMFEDYKVGHGGQYLNEAVTNIPLIIKENEQNTGKVINDLVEQVDITATILDIADIPVPEWVEGRSLTPMMRGETLTEKPVFSMGFEQNPRGIKIKKGVVAVWYGRYKFVHYLNTDKSLLFDLKEDPHEKNNIINEKSDMAQRFVSLILNNINNANKKFID